MGGIFDNPPERIVIVVESEVLTKCYGNKRTPSGWESFTQSSKYDNYLMVYGGEIPWDIKIRF